MIKIVFENKLNAGECRDFKCREFKSVPFKVLSLILFSINFEGLVFEEQSSEAFTNGW
jgi:hypothetical protein